MYKARLHKSLCVHLQKLPMYVQLLRVHSDVCSKLLNQYKDQADRCAIVTQQPVSVQCQFTKEHCVSGWMYELTSTVIDI